MFLCMVYSGNHFLCFTGTGPVVTADDLSLMKELSLADSNGSPFIGFSQNCWTELNPLQ